MAVDTLYKSESLPVDIRAVRWLLQMPMAHRRRFLAALAECSDDVQTTVMRMIELVENPNSTGLERERAANTIRDALELQPFQHHDGMDLAEGEADAAARDPEVDRIAQRMDSQESAFWARVCELLKNKSLTQAEVASRIGCSQPAISQMLNRRCRPQRQTILKLAEALDVHPRELWPDLEVTDILDTVAAVQEAQTMSQAEAEAFRRALDRPPADAPAAPLPKRQR